MAVSLALIALAYLLGSVSGSLLLGRLRGGVDIRRLGSGNAGGTNALRTQGWRFASGVVIVDVGKGALAVWLALRMAPAEGPLPPSTLALSAGLLVVAGHCWPLWHGFRGGKGAATLIGALAVLWTSALLPLLSVWLLTILLTGYVGLATVLAVATLPLIAVWRGDLETLAFGVMASVLIVFTHRGNLARLAAGTENRFERVRLLRRRKGSDSER